jgi:hypothetical protein
LEYLGRKCEGEEIRRLRKRNRLRKRHRKRNRNRLRLRNREKIRLYNYGKEV